MQLIASHQEIKMNDVSNGNPSASPNSDSCTPAEADAIVKAFALAFYTTFSKDRAELSKYYGHESLFNFENSNVIGQQEIANFYSAQFPEKVYIKIHSMKGIPTVHQGIAVQVLGSINNRTFVQSFVLGQQSTKKYYVENDILQFVPEVLSKENEHSKTAHNNGHIFNNKQEKKQTVEPTPIAKAQPTVKTPQKPQPTPKKAEVKVEKTPPKEQTPTKPVEKNHEQAKSPNQKKPVVQQAAPAPAPVPQEPPKPKTWANMVGSGVSKGPTQSSPQQQQPQQPQQAPIHQTTPPKPQVQQVQREVQPQHAPKTNRDEVGKTPECKIYLGGINRVIVPDSTATAETEIKSLFYHYGEVHDVYIPKKVIDHPNDNSKTAYAFITMRYPEAVRKIFDVATKDEQGQYRLKLKIDAFGFDGTATISEQKDRPYQHGSSGGYRPRTGFQQRGGFVPRGRGSYGGPGRGGMRGGFHNQTNGQ